MSSPEKNCQNYVSGIYIYAHLVEHVTSSSLLALLLLAASGAYSIGD